MEEIDINDLDESKVYCNSCLSLGIITELPFSNKSNSYSRPLCAHNKTRNFYCRVFRNNEWVIVRGTDPTQQTQKEKVLENTKPGLCSICGLQNDRRDISSRGYQCGCHDNWFKQHNSSKLMREASSKNMFRKHKEGVMDNVLSKLNNTHEEFCEKCNANTLHNGFGTCLSCNKSGFIKTFIEENGRTLCYIKSLGEYLDWEEVKSKIELSNVEGLFEGFELVSTFRTQDSTTWVGSCNLFEQYLVENNYKWLTYIKFYIDKSGKLKPLVVGKTGSRLVNSCGTDVSFSTKVDDGPSRRFLYESNLEWCKTQIAVMSFENESEAIDKEKELLYKYNLFSS